jgi:hypothetical protein
LSCFAGKCTPRRLLETATLIFKGHSIDRGGLTAAEESIRSAAIGDTHRCFAICHA